MIKKIPEIFLRSFPHGEKIELFRRILYLFLLLNALSLLPIANEIFGYHGIVGTSGWNTSVPWYSQGSKALLNVLSHPLNSPNPWIAYFFVFGQITALIFGLFKFWPRLSAIAVYFFTTNLFLKGYLVFTGGEALINILLFYLIFIHSGFSKKKEKDIPISVFQNVLNNTFYWILLIQICVVYLFSTLYKFGDAYWQSGEALMYIARVDAFSGDSMRFFFADNPVLSAIGTYIALIYQGLFPILVWVKRIKIPFLILGVIVHLGIAFGMGIFTFGIVMILTYILFLDINQIKVLKCKLKRWLRFKADNLDKVNVKN